MTDVDFAYSVVKDADEQGDARADELRAQSPAAFALLDVIDRARTATTPRLLTGPVWYVPASSAEWRAVLDSLGLDDVAAPDYVWNFQEPTNVTEDGYIDVARLYSPALVDET